MPHFGQACSCLAFSASCERRMPVREFECLRFGRAIVQPVFNVRFRLFENPPAYGEPRLKVKGGSLAVMVQFEIMYFMSRLLVASKP